MSGKTVLITGSNRGIGLAFTKHYATNGWKVIAAARDPQSATDLKELKLEKIVQIDTSDEASITAAAEQLKGRPIDLLINNAGIGGGGGIDQTTKAEMMKQFEVNAVGPFLMTRAFLPNLKLAVAQNGSATVGQVSSRMGSISDNGSGGMYGYRGSKTALNMVNSSLAHDLKDDKIIALALHPGYVVTRMTGHTGQTTTEDSVAGLTKIIAKATPEDSGNFFHFNGSNLSCLLLRFTVPVMAAVTADYKLFTPLKLGDDLELKNRIVFGPLSRGRANADRVPSEDNEIYYEQRAGAGLIISEATAISEQGYGWYHAAACYTDAHVEGWKRVTERVHKKGGKIFMQMWHMGRQGHTSFNPKGDLVSASALRLEGGHTRNANYEASPYETPRALETDEIAGVVESYRHGAELALKAGFDGVEIHSANGYLIDQFLQSSTNKRTDKYGGSFENRARFLMEIVDAVKTVVPSHRIGVRLAPNGAFAGMGSEDNYEMFKYTMEQLSEHKLGYLAILDGFGFGYTDKCRLTTAFDAKTAFKGIVMANNNYTRDTAEGVVRSGSADLVGFGRLYISNPDLAERFQNDWPVNPEAPREVYYNSALGGKGYNDFPFYQAKDELSN
ncbi:hypothetical protein JM18_008931 [Phytophthora kernoviae]|uniref:NADH:flavin oxidoreductase/NADH oxidase N-terminal domain-containing protein n=2 Tax=Phytophthora kernoviae TaxID=325452 RepID=A0A8T0LLC5_9STRA|nr:hypothetical protein JM16_008904 [Phytophthora kernoviae]KAG2510636.1 hypothetical protein JM18_008931 [Phytophthora kernoviae]